LTKRRIDPITLAVVRNNLISIANGMQETAFRCAVTTFMYEIMDCCFGLLDEDCGVVAQSHGILLFLGSLSPATKKSVEIIGKENLEPGDVIVSTSPEITGAHPSDALVFTPIFYKGKISGYATTKSHWQDMGAKDTFPTNSTEAYGEGLRIPPVRLYKKGVLQREIWDIIKLNSRAPDLVWGDMQAQIAGCRSAERGIVELLARYGADIVRGCIAEMYRYSRTMIEEAIEKVPDGVYTAEDYLDDNGVDPDKPVALRVAITVKGRGVTVDFTGSAPEQRGPMNGLLVSTIAASRAAIKALTTPELPANEGFYRAIEVIAPEGTVVNSGPSSPKFLYAWVAQIILDLVNKALHKVLPEKVPALSGADVVGQGFVGMDPATKRYWGTLTPCIVGQGGDFFSDGANYLYPLAAGACKNTPTEVLESTYPLEVERVEFIQDSGGPGKHRGGLGSKTTFSLPASATFFSFIEKGKTPHWGIFGGKEGLRNFALVQSKEKGEFEVLKHPGVELQAGDRVLVTAGGGGGYGDPLERDPEAVRLDVVRRYVSLERARLDYGVVLTTDLKVDVKATEQMRASMRGSG
jgi:N-methylhydantoinase B